MLATTERRYFPARDLRFGPVGRFFEGEATSEIALRAGLMRDFWAAYQPEQEGIRQVVDALDRRVADKSPAEQAAVTGRFVRFLRDSPPPGTFRVIESPLVSWIWLGAIVTFVGGLLALWPAPDAARRRRRRRARRGRGRRRPRPPARAPGLRVLGLRPGGRGAGAVARRRRAAHQRVGGPARRGGERRAPQPPALRRLPRPCGDGAALRRRRRVVGLPAGREPGAVSRRPRGGRRLRGHVRAGDGRHLLHPRRDAGEDRPRRGARRAPRR